MSAPVNQPQSPMAVRPGGAPPQPRPPHTFHSQQQQQQGNNGSPSFTPPQHSTQAVRPGFVPVRPGQPVPSPQQFHQKPPPPSQQFQRPPPPLFQRPPLPVQQHSSPHQPQLSPQQKQQLPHLQQGSPAPVLHQQQVSSPPTPVEDQMRNMQISSGVHRPGRSKRVYATLPNTPLPSNNSPNPQQSYQQSPYQQPQQPMQHQQQQTYQQQQPYQQQPYQQQQQPVVQDQQQQQQPFIRNTPLGLPPRPNTKPRIDPNQLPSPIQIQAKDEEFYQRPDQYYGTCTRDTVPLASTDFKTLDQGNSNPRFMRATLNDVPQTHELVRDTGLPFGLVIQPLAPTHAEDAPLPVIPLRHENSEPTRCTRCKGYLNPWCKYIDAGRKFVCNLCDFENSVPEDQYCPSDASGRRMDTEQHPELMFGSVEFDVPKDYWNGDAPQPLRYLFAVDVSRNAVQSGMLANFCQTMKHLLLNDSFPESMEIGIVTFDNSIHFYNLEEGLEQASMMVVSDIDDVFVPISRGLFVDPRKSRTVIEGLLNQLPTLYNNTLVPNAAFGASIQAALVAMKTTGGKVSVFQSSLPAIGPGVLKNRDDPKLYASEREKGLFAPQDSFYTQLGSECIKKGVSVDLWLFPPPNTYMDVATIGVLSALTGGDTHYYPGFKPEQSLQFAQNFTHAIQREQGYRAALRLRCSNGLSVDDQYGNFSMSNATDIELAGVHADTSIGIALKHDGGKLAENSQVYFQCALLYTTSHGQRRVRVHNLSVGVGVTANPVFKNADLDTSLNFIIKRTITLSAKRSLSDLSNELDSQCVKILTAYRKYCASDASPAQLILPESFKVLPLLLSSFKKSAVLRKDDSLNVDHRVYNMRKIKALGIAGTIKWLYPRCVKLHTWFAQEDKNTLPLERLSYDRFDAAGIYWIESHSAIYVWIGKNASADVVQSIFGVSEFAQINPHMMELPVVEGSINNQELRALYRKVTEKTSYLPQLNVIRHGLDLEVELSKVLIEDEVFNQMSYVDYLCMIHKQIQSELEREKHDNVISSASYWAYRY